MSFCKCGCGQEIIIKPHHKYRGVPIYIHGHNNKGKCLSPEWASLIGKRAIERHFTDKMRQEICEMYIKEGLSTKKIAEKLNTNRGVISKRLKEEGITIRGSRVFSGEEKYRKDVVVSSETREKISKAGKANFQNEDFVKRRNELLSKHPRKPLSDEVRKKISETLTGRPLSEETKNKLRGRKGVLSPSFGKIVPKERREKLSKAIKRKWLDREYVLMMANARNIKPNKPETFLINLLNDMYPGQWKYTGDFSFTINGKNPDFVNCNGQKKIIEFNGSYWHKNDTPGERESMFAKFGYETLIIWDNEMGDIDKLKEKIANFNKNTQFKNECVDYEVALDNG